MIDVDRILYWFLTRRPGMKLALIAVILVVFLTIGLSILLALNAVVAGANLVDPVEQHVLLLNYLPD